MKNWRRAQLWNPRMIRSTTFSALYSFLVIICFFIYCSPGEGRVSEEKLLSELLEWLENKGAENLRNGKVVNAVVTDGPSLLEDAARSLPGLSPLAEGKWKSRLGIGLAAASDFETEDILAVLPKNFVISADQILEDEKFPCSKPPKNSTLYRVVALAAWLLREKARGNESEWGPYMAVLPGYVPLPLFFDDELLDEFQDEEVASAARESAATIEEIYGTCSKEGLGDATVGEFAHAIALTVSRTFHTGTAACGRGKGDLALVPFADLLDHSYSKTNVEYDCHMDGSFTLNAMTPIYAGEPLLIMYEKAPNSHWAMMYGYIPEDNPHDYTVLFHTIPEIADYYITHFRVGEFDENDVKWAHYVAHTAVNYVNAFLRQPALGIKRVLDDYREETGYCASPEARVEPRLVAVLAAVWHYDYYRKEPDFDKLTPLSVKFGWKENDVTCDHLNEFPDGVNYGIQRALGVIFDRAREILVNMSTTYDQDMATLGLLYSCHSENKRCPEDFTNLYPELQLVLSYRTAKKKLLHNLNTRLLEICPGQSDETYENVKGNEESGNYSSDVSGEEMRDSKDGSLPNEKDSGKSRGEAGEQVADKVMDEIDLAEEREANLPLEEEEEDLASKLEL